jgi:hypothetical protein
MTRDDIIRMAIDAIGGDMNGQDVQHLVWRLENFDTDIYEFEPDALLKFAALVAATEREACAKMCEAIEDDEFYWGRQYADAIRERGKP